MAKTLKRRPKRVRERTATEAQREEMRARIQRGLRMEKQIRDLTRRLESSMKRTQIVLEHLFNVLAEIMPGESISEPASVERELAGARE